MPIKSEISMLRNPELWSLEDRRAVNLTTMLMEEVAKKLLAFQDVDTARREVCQLYAGEMVRHAGKHVADRCIRAVHTLERDEFLIATERQELNRIEREQLVQWKKDQAAWQAEHDAILARCAPHLLPRRTSPWSYVVDALIVFVVIGLALIVFYAPASAREAPDRLRALAACGVVSMNSPEYERRCRRFSRTERSTVRDYDPPGAGAPRDWERSRDYD